MRKLGTRSIHWRRYGVGVVIMPGTSCSYEHTIHAYSSAALPDSHPYHCGIGQRWPPSAPPSALPDARALAQWIERQQNPADCDAAKFVVVTLRGGGIASQLQFYALSLQAQPASPAHGTTTGAECWQG